ncbi:MAG: TetR/AcrR family transcriptional regulator [Microbacterium sp.]|uniref:TetR/AcrR family transcriptional regulator n=1 Tax=Microbacterium sp. TaxID=51671 RepID=UPI0039E30BC9
MARAPVYDDDLRDRLVSRAMDVVASSGAEGLSLRALAASEGTTTTAIYTLFGSKEFLLGSVFERIFAMIVDVQDSVALTGSARDDILALCLAYWQWGVDNPRLYALVFHGAASGGATGVEHLMRRMREDDPIGRAVRRGVENGELVGDPFVLTVSFWLIAHGASSLWASLPAGASLTWSIREPLEVLFDGCAPAR